MVDQAPYIWLPTQYVYSAWWPWVKNYSGEYSVGYIRYDSWATWIWIDEALKESMGY